MAEKGTVGTAFRRAVGEPPVIPEVRTRPESLGGRGKSVRRPALRNSPRVGKFACLSIPGQVDGAMLRDLALLDIEKNAAIIKVLLRRARTRSQVSTDLKVYPQALDPSLKNLL